MFRLVGRTVNLKLINGEHEVDVVAKVDTGAYSSSIDESIAKALNLSTDNSVQYLVKSASGTGGRDFFKILVSDGLLTTESLVNIAVRSHLTYKMILGRKDIGVLEYLVDVSREQYRYKKPAKAKKIKHPEESQEPIPKGTVVPAIKSKDLPAVEAPSVEEAPDKENILG